MAEQKIRHADTVIGRITVLSGVTRNIVESHEAAMEYSTWRGVSLRMISNPEAEAIRRAGERDKVARRFFTCSLAVYGTIIAGRPPVDSGTGLTLAVNPTPIQAGNDDRLIFFEQVRMEQSSGGAFSFSRGEERTMLNYPKTHRIVGPISPDTGLTFKEDLDSDDFVTATYRLTANRGEVFVRPVMRVFDDMPVYDAGAGVHLTSGMDTTVDAVVLVPG